ncbi:MAG: DP-EP family protein [Gemmatimonadaceae bacterium]
MRDYQPSPFRSAERGARAALVAVAVLTLGACDGASAPTAPTAALHGRSAATTTTTQTVMVSFVAPTSWSFSPNTATLDASGDVVLALDQNTSSSYRITDVTIKKDDLGQFTVSIAADGKTATIHDSFQAGGTFGYRVTVTDATGRTYRSPDPQIENKT